MGQHFFTASAFCRIDIFICIYLPKIMEPKDCTKNNNAIYFKLKTKFILMQRTAELKKSS